MKAKTVHHTVTKITGDRKLQTEKCGRDGQTHKPVLLKFGITAMLTIYGNSVIGLDNFTSNILG